MGRPSDYSPELAMSICEELAENPGGLLAICRAEGMPNRSTVYRWMDEHEDFATRCARARVLQAHHHNDECIEIADAAKTSEEAQIAKVRISARQWASMKIAPNDYGDKLDVKHAGGLTVQVLRFGDGEPEA